MTEYEKAILFVEFLGAANTVFANYATIVSAMITVSYFFAHRMRPSVAVSFLTLYSFAAISTGGGVFFAFSDFLRLGAWIADSTDTATTELGWLGPVAAGATNMGMAIPSLALAVITPYLGSVGFFVLIRQHRAYRPAPGDIPVPEEEALKL